MDGLYTRTEALVGTEATERLKAASVAVFGVGGVGSAAVEALARCGVGHIAVIDCDVVDVTNKNRQLIALDSTVGLPKVDVAEMRIRDVNPEARVDKFQLFYGKETEKVIDFSLYDYVIDAIDNVTAKLLIAKNCVECGTELICCLGTGNRLRADLLTVTDISKTYGCPLARVMRRELKLLGITSLKVLFSTEEPKKTGVRVPASIAFVPNAAGLLIAQEVVLTLIGEKK